MKIFLYIILMAVSLAGCNDYQCARNAAALDAKWTDVRPVTKEGVKLEINELLAENNCSAVTPWRVRKVMTDIMAARQCSQPATMAKIYSYTRHDVDALRDVVKDIAGCSVDIWPD